MTSRLRAGIRENWMLRAIWGSLFTFRSRAVSAMKAQLLWKVGYDCMIYSMARIHGGRHVTLGNRVTINDFVHIWGTGGVTIGDDTMIAAHSAIVSATHDVDAMKRGLKYRETMTLKPVTIGKNVWIGTAVVILPGISIGDHSVAGAGSVVTKDIPSCSVAVGVPARVTRGLGGPPEPEGWIVT